MIKFKIGELERELKSELGEITVPEFEKMCLVINSNLNHLDRHIAIFEILGLIPEEIDMLTPQEFIKLSREFNSTLIKEEVFRKEVIVNGKTYTAFTGDKFILSVRDLAKIEKYMISTPESFLGEMLAVIYKDLSLPKELWYKEEHIKEKALLFREHLTAEILLPFVSLLLKDIINNLRGNA